MCPPESSSSQFLFDLKKPLIQSTLSIGQGFLWQPNQVDRRLHQSLNKLTKAEIAIVVYRNASKD